MANEYAIARAEEAKRLAESDVFNEAFNRLKEILTERLVNSEADEGNKRELLYHRIQLLDELKGALIRIMNEGEIEGKSLRFKRR